MPFGSHLLDAKLSVGAIDEQLSAEVTVWAEHTQLKQLSPVPGQAIHWHMRVELFPGEWFEFDTENASAIDYDQEVNYDVLPSFGVGSVVGKGWVGKTMVTIKGPAAAMLLDAAQKGPKPKAGLGYTADPSLWEPMDSGPVKKLWEPEPPKPPYVVQVFGKPLPFAWDGFVQGVEVAVTAVEVLSTGKVRVVVVAHTPDGGEKYASLKDIEQEIWDSASVHLAKAVDLELNALILDAVKKAAMHGINGTLLEWFTSTTKKVSSPLTPKMLTDAVKALGEQAAQAAKPMAAFQEAMKTFAFPFVGSTHDYEQLAAERDLAVRVVADWPAKYHLLLALYKFDGRPAEFEEVESFQLKVNALMPVGVVVSCEALTPALAKKLPDYEAANKAYIDAATLSHTPPSKPKPGVYVVKDDPPF